MKIPVISCELPVEVFIEEVYLTLLKKPAVGMKACYLTEAGLSTCPQEIMEGNIQLHHFLGNVSTALSTSG